MVSKEKCRICSMLAGQSLNTFIYKIEVYGKVPVIEVELYRMPGFYSNSAICGQSTQDEKPFLNNQ